MKRKKRLQAVPRLSDNSDGDNDWSIVLLHFSFSVFDKRPKKSRFFFIVPCALRLEEKGERTEKLKNFRVIFGFGVVGTICKEIGLRGRASKQQPESV
jgi:hypothetical protein